METYGFFMIGNPGDNPTEVRKTIELAKELEPDIVTFSITEAYPGTDLYRWAIKNRALKDRYWYMKNINRYIGVVILGACLELEYLSVEQQIVFLKKAYREFYMKPRYIFKRIFKIRNFDQLKDMVSAFFEIVRSTGSEVNDKK